MKQIEEKKTDIGLNTQKSACMRTGLLSMNAKRQSEPLLKVFQDTNRLKQVNSTMHGSTNLKEYRHKLHPTSKLLIGNAYGVTSTQRETMKIDRNKTNTRVQDEYRLTTKRHSSIIDQKRFKATLSQGPRGLQTDHVG